jgi:hypothetical protein
MLTTNTTSSDSVKPINSEANLSNKKAWITPDIEIISSNDIKSGTTPHSYEDAYPYKTFQHS